MLFNSYDFIFFFLPITLGSFWLLSGFQKCSFVVGWLILVSLYFYSVWNASFLFLLLANVSVNWLVGEGFIYLRRDLLGDKNVANRVRLLLILGVTFNLGFLGYFKYINFFIDTVNNLGLNLETISGLILPLGISFYTFEQISYLASVASGKSEHYDFPRFLLFVVFFPHLIAGPILSADELIPQFQKLNFRFDVRNLAIGFTLFSFGLFKKAVIADSVAVFSTPVFQAADQGEAISFLVAWQASIAYTLQLYFDFSGYSDMAIGLSKMVNIKLPMNFFSPYKAISIGDFWRRWHISLGRFLRDYIYIPLGGSRTGEVRRYANLLITMLLGGLWHGANWTFILWGMLHGVYLCIDHAWKRFLKQKGLAFESRYHYWLARMLTFLAVIVSWVLFRAETLSGAGRILAGMFGGNGLILPEKFVDKLGYLSHFGVQFGTLNSYFNVNGSTLQLLVGNVDGLFLLLLVLGFALFLPNLYQFMIHEPVALDIYNHLPRHKPAWYAWRPTFGYAFLTSVVFVIALIFSSIGVSEFLYFQF